MSKQDFTIGAVRADQIEELSNLLISHRISLLGRKNYSFLSDFLKDSLRLGNPCVIVGSNDIGKIVGWTIAIENSKSYWKNFLRRHPVHCLCVICDELSRRYRHVFHKLPSKTNGINTELHISVDHWAISNKWSWGESKNGVARHIDITVLEDFRGLELGHSLYLHQLATLKLQGVTQIDACIRADNIRSQHFHIRENWSLVTASAEWIYITKNTDKA